MSHGSIGLADLHRQEPENKYWTLARSGIMKLPAVYSPVLLQ